MSASGQTEPPSEAGISAPGPALEQPPTLATPEIAPPGSAVRGGALVVGSSAAGIFAVYLFLLASGRLLGSTDYGTLAALTGLLTVVTLPTSALQMAVSREVAHALALGEAGRAKAFVRAGLSLSLKATLPVLAIGFALLVPLERVLHIHSAGAVAIALATLVTAFAAPFALGVLQGYQRFRALALVSFAPLGARLVLLGVLAVAGLRLFGAVAAVTLGAVLGLVLAVASIADSLGGRAEAVGVPLRPFLRYLGPVVLGLLAIALLTNVDILVIKARFSGHEAGVYAAASAFARVGFFLPAAFLTVLFPRTAARQARGEEAGDILGRSLIVTVGFCAAVIGIYALLGHWLVRLTFGAEFGDATSLLVPFAAAMTCLSLTNVLVGFHLSRGETRFAWIATGGVVVQVLALATLPTTLRQAVLVNAAVGLGLLAAHELTVESSLPALRAGTLRLRQQLLGPATHAALRRAARVAAEGAVVLGLASALTVALTWPLSAHPGRYLLGGGANDGTGGVAWLWELRHEGGYHVLGLVHHTLTGAPLGWDAGNALNLQWLVPYLPAYLLSGSVGEVTAFNLVVLAGLALSGAAMYGLVRWLGCGRLVGGWAGFVFIVFPWHLDRAMAGHGSLVHIEVFPLFVLAFLIWWRRPTWLRLALVALATSFAWLTAALFGIMLVVVTPALLAAVVWRDRLEVGLRRAAVRAAGAGAAVLAGTVAVALLAIPGASRGGLGSTRAEDTLYGNGAWLQSFVTLRGLSQSESRVYLGWVTILLAAGWLLLAVRRRDRLSRTLRMATLSLGLMVLVAFVFSLANPLPVAGRLAHPMPSWFLWKLVSQFRNPARFIAVVMTGLVALAALGLQALGDATRARARSRFPSAALPAIVCLVALAASFAELSVTVVRQQVDQVPPEYSALARTPRGILAEYPLDQPAIGQTLQYQFWQRIHGRPLLNGAADGTTADDVRRAFADPCARGAAASLAFLGVTAIITRPNTYGDFPSHNHLPAPTSCAGFRFVERFADGATVWRNTAAPAPAVAVFRGAGFGQPDLPQGRFVGQPFSGGSGQIELYTRSPGLWLLQLPVLVPSTGTTIVVSGSDGARSFRPSSSRALVGVPVLLQRGRSTLSIRVSSPGESVFAGLPFFARASVGDGARAVRPNRQSARLPFG